MAGVPGSGKTLLARALPGILPEMSIEESLDVTRIDGNVYYMLKDRLGSAYATTDTLGNVVGEMRYYAFGETRLSTGTMFTDRLFTGQRWIADLGIYHFNARFYSPKLGRFLSADSILSGMANPQNLNRFSYVANNPLRYTDPTGHMMTEYDGGAGGCYGSTCTPISTSPVKYSPKPTSTTPSTSSDDSSGAATGTPTYTPTVNPTYESLLTTIPTQSYILTPPIGTPTPEFSIGPITTVTPWPTTTPQPTSEFWAIARDEHTPFDPTPSERIPPGFEYNFWQAVDTAVKTVLPLLGYPATTKNIADALSGQTAVKWVVDIVGPAISVIVRTGSGIYYVPNNSPMVPGPIYQN